MPKPSISDDARKILDADHFDPFSYLGLHQDSDGTWRVRAFIADAVKLDVLNADGTVLGTAKPLHADGLFDVALDSPDAPTDYQLRATWPTGTDTFDDPYRFDAQLGEVDRYLLREGTHYRTFDKLGAQITEVDGVDGVLFSVWAPNARRVSVVGEFNGWDGRRHPMRLHPGCGIWEIFVPGVGKRTLYKFEIKARDGTVLPLKADPYAQFMEQAPGTASIVYGLGDYEWGDDTWMKTRADTAERHAPISIYEVHLGSWRRNLAEGGRALTYRELADELVSYVQNLGFTHIELLPVSEYPFDGSWGYQPIGLFAPTSRFGEPDDFRHFIDRCHQAGIGVILDWVVGHFPEDSHGLVQFDGTHLYEHADPKMGRHADWGTLIYNFGRNEVANYLLANALYWIEHFHIDGLRVDAVASMLYLDYSREPGEWTPNEFGGNENLQAIDFLKRVNELVYHHHPGAFTVAEESTAWPMVSRPTYLGGLGFGYKWNMGWMHDTLTFMKRDPIHRHHHFDDLTFGLLYAFQENFVLPLSHDEVVHGKGSLIGRMPGDRWQQFANLRLYLAFMFAHPGKKLLFMGAEFAQEREWNHDIGLDWHLLDDDHHRGVHTMLRDLNTLYREHAPLHVADHEPDGFSWIECHDADQSVLAFSRWDPVAGKAVIVVCNLTPVVREGYALGVPWPGTYGEIFNSDSTFYGGSDVGNAGELRATETPTHGQEQALRLTLPPLATLMLAWQPGMKD